MKRPLAWRGFTKLYVSFESWRHLTESAQSGGRCRPGTARHRVRELMLHLALMHSQSQSATLQQSQMTRLTHATTDQPGQQR